MTPIFLILGQSNAGLMERSGALQSALEALGSDAVVVGVHGGGFSSARADGEWNIIEGDGSSAGGEAYDDLLSTMEQVRADIPDAYIAGAVWLQGESDRSASLDYYGAVDTLFNQMHEDLGEEFPITILGLSDFQADDGGMHHVEHVQDSQMQLAQDLAFVSFIDPDQLIAENGLSEAEVMRDDLHYNPGFFDYVADALLAQPGVLESLGLGGPVDDPVFGPIEDDPVEDPIEDDPIVDDPIEEDPADDPVEDDPVDDPVEDEPADDPVEDDPVDDPVEDDPVDDPVEDDPVDDPVEDDPADDPVEDDPADDPVEDDPAEDEPADDEDETVPAVVPEDTDPPEDAPMADAEDDSGEAAGAALLGSIGLLMGSGVGLALGAVGALLALVGGGRGEGPPEDIAVSAALPKRIELGNDVRIEDILPVKAMSEDDTPLETDSDEEELVLEL